MAEASIMATHLKSIETAADPLDDMSLPGWLYFDDEFFEAEKAIIRDLRSLPLSIRGYSIMLHPRGQFVSVRIERRRFGAMKKQFEVLATSTSAEALEMKLSRLRLEPFEPVRRQILFLVRKVNAIRRRAGLSQINPPIFRCAKSISIYANKAASF